MHTQTTQAARCWYRAGACMQDQMPHQISRTLGRLPVLLTPQVSTSQRRSRRALIQQKAMSATYEPRVHTTVTTQPGRSSAAVQATDAAHISGCTHLRTMPCKQRRQNITHPRAAEGAYQMAAIASRQHRPSPSQAPCNVQTHAGAAAQRLQPEGVRERPAHRDTRFHAGTNP